MNAHEILKRIRQIEFRTNRIVTETLAGFSFFTLLLLCSCATRNSACLELPAETPFNETDGRDPIFITLGLKTGEKLLFSMDSGSPVTVLDKSMEEKLGARLGTIKSNFAFRNQENMG